jgi:signal transduction histidine kinase
MASASGIPLLGDLPPGAHVGQLYRDQADLLATLVPFFVAGLTDNERCIWVTAHPLRASEARAALANAVPDLARRERAGQIDILDHETWYLRSGTLGPSEVIQGWLDAEENALAQGYQALRVSGNTFWLGPDQWDAFCDYEARVHAAFRGRKIVALCSYALEKCQSDAVVDVLRNHTVSLIHGHAGCQVVHGATAALAALAADSASVVECANHDAEFYRGELPAGRIADRLVHALQQGRGAFALVRREHVERIRAELARRSIAIDLAIQAGRLAILDADAIHAEVALWPGVRREAIDRLVFQPTREIIERCGGITCYGELVDVFACEGDHASAIELEQMWSDHISGKAVDLVCGYALGSFSSGDDAGAFRRVCDAHGAVGVDAEPGDSETDRLRVELAQATSALSQETARRQSLEKAFTTTAGGREQLVRLERLSAALGEVTTRLGLVEITTDLVVSAVEADGLVIVEADVDHPVLVEHGAGVEELRQLAVAADGRAIWSPDGAALGGTHPPLRGFITFPLDTRGHHLGMAALGYTSPRSFSPAYRAFVQDVVRQIALAYERATTYERLEQERERAELASRAKDEFLAMLGHELRNPLSPILTATQLMRLRASEGNERERTVIERQVKHMIRLVDDLLDVSRITRGKVDLRRRAIELSEVVAQAVELSSPALEERSHRLTLDVPQAGVVIHADPQRIAQVLTNLLTNAAKYTPAGGEIHLGVHAGTSTVAISVRDNGIGIDPKLLPHIFDLFVQGRQGIDRASGGLGLGLAIAKSLLEMHGGTIRAHSEGTGKGSEFTLELPRFANTRPSRNNMSGSFPLPQGRGRRVLVVDDNEDAAFLFSEALKRLGHEVDVAHDGPSALERARERLPEIAFLDIGLPVMDGYELGRRLLELDRAKPPRLVAVTGYGHTSDRERSRDAGFEKHLVKPIELSTVQDVLSKLD